MEAIQLVIGWFNKIRSFTAVDKVTPSELTPSKRGYRFEHEELKRLMKRLSNFETVKFTDAYGTALTPDTIDKRFGRDGGIDCVIHVIAPTERGASNVAGRIRNIIINGDY
jgi:hypothetical protein